MTNEREFRWNHYAIVLLISAAAIMLVMLASNANKAEIVNKAATTLNANVYRVDPASAEAEKIRREQSTAYAAGVNDGMRELMLLVMQAQRKQQPMDWKQATGAVKSYLEIP